MKKQLLNIFLILIVASCVFMLFWKPARTQHGSNRPTTTINASQLIQSSANSGEPRVIHKKLVTASPLVATSPMTSATIEDRKPNSSPDVTLTSLETLTAPYLSQERINSFPIKSTSDTLKLLKLYHLLVSLPKDQQNPGALFAEEKVFAQLSKNPSDTYQEIVHRFPVAQEYPDIESSFMKIVYKLDISKTDKANYLRKIYQRRFEHDHGERAVRLRTNIAEASQYLRSMQMLNE